MFLTRLFVPLTPTKRAKCDGPDTRKQSIYLFFVHLTFVATNITINFNDSISQREPILYHIYKYLYRESHPARSIPLVLVTLFVRLLKYQWQRENALADKKRANDVRC